MSMSMFKRLLLLTSYVQLVIVFSLPVKENSCVNECIDKIIIRHFEKDDLIVTNIDNMPINFSYPVVTINDTKEIKSFYFRRVDAYIIEVTKSNAVNRFENL